MDKAKSAAKPSGSGVTDVFPLPIPLDLYEFVKEAIEVMKRPNWRTDTRSYIELGSAEYKIGVLSRCFRTRLPPGWKYERENASSLIAGRDKVFTENGIRYIM
ncbi:uncharacterized protein LOC143563604 isoform X2 [Bidens hawaiensis]|uniref:uncharacterized protein LOC143563604 isoform X2 n=1 Tax=Bidens hawaiensis TaxID=980011 RepID=UPI00404AF2BB